MVRLVLNISEQVEFGEGIRWCKDFDVERFGTIGASDGRIYILYCVDVYQEDLCGTIKVSESFWTVGGCYMIYRLWTTAQIIVIKFEAFQSWRNECSEMGLWIIIVVRCWPLRDLVF